MNVLSLFSGVGGMDLGLERAGHTIVAMCEIDKHARGVLAHHWPNIPLLEDVTNVKACDCVRLPQLTLGHGTQLQSGSDIEGRSADSSLCDECGGIIRGSVDVVSGGSPCQDLSVAGRRKGLDGARSGLFWHQCRIADQCASPWFLWENVPGALSSNNGADFAAVLWGITGTHPRVPDGGWNNSGVIVGPKRWAVWRVLDAQYFGVAQRRRRVFVVGGPRTDCRPEILFESSGLPGDSAPKRTAGEEAAGTLGAGTPSGGWAGDTDRMTFLPVVGSLTTKSSDRSRDAGTQGWPIPNVIGTLQSRSSPNHEAARDGQLIPVTDVKAVGSGERDADGTRDTDRPAPSLNAFDNGHETRATVLAFEMRTRDGVPQAEITGNNVAGSLRTGTGGSSKPMIATNTAQHGVRRLTPIECERLMGWPDNWTLTRHDNKQQADSHRYRQIGNGVVSNITQWIGQRLPD